MSDQEQVPRYRPTSEEFEDGGSKKWLWITIAILSGALIAGVAFFIGGKNSKSSNNIIINNPQISSAPTEVQVTPTPTKKPKPTKEEKPTEILSPTKEPEATIEPTLAPEK